MTYLHLGAALLALALGAVVLFRRKGTATHKLLGRSWAALMIVVAVSSFWLSSPNIPNWHGFSPIHGLSLFTLISLAAAIRSIRVGNRRAHQFWMIGPYIGLIVAGLGTLAPGRLISTFLFG